MTIKMYPADKVWDYFEWKSGSKIWPSDDPNDSPFDNFHCKLCDFAFSARVNGVFSIGFNPFDGVIEKMRNHLLEKHRDKIKNSAGELKMKDILVRSDNLIKEEEKKRECWNFTRFQSSRFKFDVDNYTGNNVERTSMKHLRIYCEGAIQVDLWLDPRDVSFLKEALNFKGWNRRE